MLTIIFSYKNPAPTQPLEIKAHYSDTDNSYFHASINKSGPYIGFGKLGNIILVVVKKVTAHRKVIRSAWRVSLSITQLYHQYINVMNNASSKDSF